MKTPIRLDADSTTPKVVEEMSANGVHVAASPDDVQEKHRDYSQPWRGPDVLRRCVNEGLPSIDATMPPRGQGPALPLRSFRDMGGTVVVVGRADHPRGARVVQPCGQRCRRGCQCQQVA